MATFENSTLILNLIMAVSYNENQAYYKYEGRQQKIQNKLPKFRLRMYSPAALTDLLQINIQLIC